jgi:hypothetical protein
MEMVFRVGIHIALPFWIKLNVEKCFRNGSKVFPISLPFLFSWNAILQQQRICLRNFGAVKFAELLFLETNNSSGFTGVQDQSVQVFQRMCCFWFNIGSTLWFYCKLTAWILLTNKKWKENVDNILLQQFKFYVFRHATISEP